MSDLLEPAGPGANAHEFTVSELSGKIRRLIEGEFGHVRVRAEVGRVVLARSGHLYFDLKDDRAVLSAVSWKGQAARLAIRPEEGMEVIATGRMTAFAGQSKYQLVVEALELAGEGALMALLERRRKALAAEGLFAPERKKKLPWLPEVIGVVTSPSGAVIRDILHRLRDRFPRRVLIWPVAVQGKACAPEVARAIRGFNALAPGGAIPRPDLIIVARGGGSVEDLWGFNEEEVVRAAAESAVPLISAVGHETDTTLIDLAADMRAPTPTAAAELAVPVRTELLARVEEQGARLSRAMSREIGQRRQRLGDLSRALPRPATLLEGAAQRLDRAAERLGAALRATAQRKRLRLGELSAVLRSRAMHRRLAEARARLEERAARLQPALLSRDMARRGRELERQEARLSAAARLGLEQRRQKMEALARMLQGLGYTETLRRGYAVVRGDGRIVTGVEAARSARELEIEFADGRLPAGRAGGGGTGGAPSRRKGERGAGPDEGAQGRLF